MVDTAAVADAEMSSVHVEHIVDCPFSLAIDLAPLIFPMLEMPTGGVRVPYRSFLPIPGSIAHSVSVAFRRQPDATEPGRAHDEIAFDWNARSRWLPNFSGVLRFRSESNRTRIALDGSFAPPLGSFGRLFHRIVGHRLAQATARDILERLGRELETRWSRERSA